MAGAWSRWLPVVLWAGLISVLSSEAFSGEETGALLRPILEMLLPGAGPETIAAAHAAVRKLAHLVEYAVLGLLAGRALDRPERASTGIAAAAFVLCAAYAALDETRQTFVPSRVGSPVDVAIDVAGAAAGVAAWMLVRSAVSADRRSRA